jgi:hypothetical protein
VVLGVVYFPCWLEGGWVGADISIYVKYQLGKCPNMCFFCTQKPAIHCPSIRMGPFLLQIEAGIMSYTRMCLDSCGSLCVQIGFKLTMTAKTLIGWFCMGKQHVLAYIPNYLVVSLHIFCNGDFCYKDSIPRDTLWFGLVGGLLWRFCGEKWGLRTLRAIRHVRRNRLISSLGPRGSSTDSTKLEISQFWRKYSSHISKVTPFGASDDYL